MKRKRKIRRIDEGEERCCVEGGERMPVLKDQILRERRMFGKEEEALPLRWRRKRRRKMT